MKSQNDTPPPRGKYCRSLPKTGQPLNTHTGEEQLRHLAAAMTDQNIDNDSHIDAGFTYFGQFIDHDLTWNRDLLAPQQSGPCPIQSIPTQNFRTAFLNLEPIYGDGPGSPRSGCLYCGEAGEERFKIGSTVPSTSPVLGAMRDIESLVVPFVSVNDIPFNKKIPLMGDGFDRRNAENLIIRQLHVVFLKFHNAVIARFSNGQCGQDSPYEEKATAFQRARLLVTWTYQWIVWQFLSNLANITRDPKADASVIGKPFQLPIEFALAAFRFGHSMVREAYPLNCYHQNTPKNNTELPLAKLINLRDDHPPRLEEQFVIQWGRFFSGATTGLSVNVTQAHKIDTHITDEMRNLPLSVIRHFSEPSPGKEIRNLAFRTLLRGARALLPSGQEASQQPDNPVLDKIAKDSALQDTHLTENTPLWYYILKEAEVGGGERLGKVGGQIVVNTIEQALQHDPHSYLNVAGPNWRPPECIIGEQYESAISNLIIFAQEHSDE